MALSAVNVATTVTTIAAANWNRRLLMIQNVSDTDIYLKMDSSATVLTTSNGIKLPAGGTPLVITCNPGEFDNKIEGIHGGAGNKEVRVTEEN